MGQIVDGESAAYLTNLALDSGDNGHVDDERSSLFGAFLTFRKHFLLFAVTRVKPSDSSLIAVAL